MESNININLQSNTLPEVSNNYIFNIDPCPPGIKCRAVSDVSPSAAGAIVSAGVGMYLSILCALSICSVCLIVSILMMMTRR